MTKSAVLIISKKYQISLPEKIEILEKRWINYKSEKGKIGGFAFKKLYSNPATIEGRKKGGKRAMEILKQRGIVPPIKEFKYPPHSIELAEFVGIMLGDGGITKEQIAITLNRKADKNYILYVKKLSDFLFGEEPKYFQRKDCKADVIYYNGINIVRFITGIGLKIGNKVRQQVSVPGWIGRNIKYKIACLKGLMDTDGGIFTHKYKVNGKIYSYKKICFTNRSMPLLYFVEDTLNELGFTAKTIYKVENKKVWLYNSKEVIKYLDEIGSSNERLLKFRHGE